MKEIIEEYWNWRSATYHTELKAYEDEEQLIWKNILTSALPHERTMNVLDVGTGPGYMALAFAEMGHSVTAVDISREMLKKAKQKAYDQGATIDFYHGDAEKLPFMDGQFDLIVSKYLLWTLPSPDAFLHECQRLLSPEGIILAIDGTWFKPSISNSIRKVVAGCANSINNIHNPGIFEQYYSGVKHKLPLYHENAPEDVSSLLVNSGFEGVSYQYLLEYRDFQKRSGKLNYYINNPKTPYMIIGKKI